ncbi:MAG: hypothetical protein PHD66_09370 [Eubacteriales bacterium]|nr:hypothetical protein [Eubacteriales bacterium]
MSVTEKVSYLKGLAEGLGVEDSSKEGKLLGAIVGALEEICESLDGLEAYTTELSEQVDAIDEDLDALECQFYDEDDDDDDYEFTDDDEEYYDVVCPNCEEEFSVDEDTLLEGSIGCPNCGENLEFDIECDCDDECDCQCDDKESN